MARGSAAPVWFSYLLLTLAFAACAKSPESNELEDGTIYAVSEAYDVYAALFPKELFSKGDYRPVILRETVVPPSHMRIRECRSRSDFLPHWSLVGDFEKANRETRLLASGRLRLNGSAYDLVSRGELDQIFVGRSWDDFYHRFPKSRGYYEVSAVGFNWGKTEALVYRENVCGPLCGRGDYHYFEKLNGNWQEVFDQVGIPGHMLI
jgi:hypothetical protein